jgi:hypothetical protein
MGRFKHGWPPLTVKNKNFMFNGIEKLCSFDATAKSPKNAAKTTATLQNREGKVLLTLASF